MMSEDYAYEIQRQRRIDKEAEMKINYDEIITKANKRKDTLQALVVLIEEAPAMMAHLTCMMQWANDLYPLYRELDGEGKAMLPSAYRETLNDLDKIRDRMSQLNRFGSSGISRLVSGE